ncbi:hypothetical protein PTTG_12651 [Puccinia triticina 1-1 BBBD Race 1]|uniref:Uncharacterized protein n=2 Tax=Puccinia triticina TaxID=208348 RepID=A0A180GCV6_PUCT1|nr:uncharacterized protein PtA15_4A390 [Puccinia triticina]OAV90182.1 hypothetical protein PTTG_12651 [Puccinia triticina 1-1 BBBD Race 1]WAQ83940.1 hypothetical protein PtA15_4A390 [Puccinia triticina]WAR54786.1 hypothetical protein PtB15_4B404 [Puccinia triticina]
MLYILFFVIILIGLLPACSPYDTSDPNVKCSLPRAGRADCNKAYRQIIYEADLTLDTSEYIVERIFGNCAIMVDNPNTHKLTKQTIEDGFNKLLGHCKNNSGYFNLTAPNDKVALIIRSRQPLPTVEMDAPFKVPICYRTSTVLRPDDCNTAYDRLPTNNKGVFVDSQQSPVDVQASTFQSCSVAVYSSDGSVMTMTKQTVTPLFKQLLPKCSNTAAGMILPGGVQGRNGRFQIIIRRPL